MQQIQLVPGSGNKRKSHGQFVYPSHGHGNVWVTRHGRRGTKIKTCDAVAVHQVDAAYRTDAGAAKGVQFVVEHQLVDDRPGAQGVFQGVLVLWTVESSQRLALFQKFLFKPGHFMFLVELDDVLQGFDLCARRSGVLVQTIPKFVFQDV